MGSGDPFKISQLEEEIESIEKCKQDNHFDDKSRKVLLEKNVVMVFIQSRQMLVVAEVEGEMAERGG